MRIISGVWRGRAISAPPGRATRPTSDRVREALFAVLGALPEIAALRRGDAGPLSGHVVLDLFAGSGACGLEALSRGAAHCTFVERDAGALRALRANLNRLAVPIEPLNTRDQHERASSGAARVIGSDAEHALTADARVGAQYTLLLLDPPYAASAKVRPMLTGKLGPVLAPGAVIVVETAARAPLELPWRMLRERRYGDTHLTFMVNDAGPATRGAVDDET